MQPLRLSPGSVGCGKEHKGCQGCCCTKLLLKLAIGKCLMLEKQIGRGLWERAAGWQNPLVSRWGGSAPGRVDRSSRYRLQISGLQLYRAVEKRRNPIKNCPPRLELQRTVKFVKTRWKAEGSPALALPPSPSHPGRSRQPAGFDTETKKGDGRLCAPSRR